MLLSVVLLLTACQSQSNLSVDDAKSLIEANLKENEQPLCFSAGGMRAFRDGSVWPGALTRTLQVSGMFTREDVDRWTREVRAVADAGLIRAESVKDEGVDASRVTWTPLGRAAFGIEHEDPVGRDELTRVCFRDFQVTDVQLGEAQTVAGVKGVEARARVVPAAVPAWVNTPGVAEALNLNLPLRHRVTYALSRRDSGRWGVDNADTW